MICFKIRFNAIQTLRVANCCGERNVLNLWRRWFSSRSSSSSSLQHVGPFLGPRGIRDLLLPTMSPIVEDSPGAGQSTPRESPPPTARYCPCSLKQVFVGPEALNSWEQETALKVLKCFSSSATHPKLRIILILLNRNIVARVNPPPPLGRLCELSPWWQPSHCCQPSSSRL